MPQECFFCTTLFSSEEMINCSDCADLTFEVKRICIGCRRKIIGKIVYADTDSIIIDTREYPVFLDLIESCEEID